VNQISGIFTSQVTGCQVHAIGKAIRPIFNDQVTNGASIVSQVKEALRFVLLVLIYKCACVCVCTLQVGLSKYKIIPFAFFHPQ